MATIQLSSIINGDYHVNVSSLGRLSDEEVAQCICNASIGVLSTRQLLEHFKLFQADKPHVSYQSWAVERGLWATWTTKAGKIKPVGAGERKAELVKIHGDKAQGVAEYRVLCQYDCIRMMLSNDKDAAERLHKMDQIAGETVEVKQPETAKPAPALPDVMANLITAKNDASQRLNRLIAQVAMDESLTWLSEELTAISALLK